MTEDVRKQFARMRHKVTAPAAKRQTDLEIMPRNWSSLLAFLACQTHWRVVATMGGLIWLGLDYTAARGALDEAGLPIARMADLRAIEAAALPILNEAR